MMRLPMQSLLTRAPLCALFAIALSPRPSFAAGESDNDNPATQWCALTAAERMCICQFLPCFPKEVQDALNSQKGEDPPAGGTKWKAPGKACKQKLNPPGPGEKDALGRTIVVPATGEIKGIAFDPKFFAADIMWKKTTVRQEANRVSYGNMAPEPYAGVGPGAFTNMEEMIAVGCWKAAYQGLNAGLSASRDVESRSSMVGSPPPQGVTAEAWKDFVCKQVLPAADAALQQAEGAKAQAMKDAAAKTAPGPGGDANATPAKLKEWLDKLCKEIEQAKKALAAAKAACQ